MTTRNLFATPLYEAKLKNAALVAELERSCHALAEDDRAGRSWSKAHGYRGYTSYASLNDLPVRDPAFGDLVKLLNKHVAKFADECAFELDGGKLKLDSLWWSNFDRVEIASTPKGDPLPVELSVSPNSTSTSVPIRCSVGSTVGSTSATRTLRPSQA